MGVLASLLEERSPYLSKGGHKTCTIEGIEVCAQLLPIKMIEYLLCGFLEFHSALAIL